MLENEIIANTTKYSDVASNIGGTPLSYAGPTVEDRGTHGMAMKDPCEDPYFFTSKPSTRGGFGALFSMLTAVIWD